MDWENAQALIVPVLWVIFQALKKIVAIGEDNQYIPLAAILLGALMTVLWTLAVGGEGSAAVAEALLRGCIYGAGAVGLYELLKS